MSAPSATLPLRLCHCAHAEGLVRQRHNAILGRLTEAINPQGRQVFREQEVPGDNAHLKPDLVVLSGDTGVIVDVTVPFESGPQAFAEARRAKEIKYASLIGLLRTAHPALHNVEVHGFVVGALGSWDTGNEAVLGLLGFGQRYAHLFRSLCAMDAIRGSHSIWQARCQRRP